VTLWSDLGVPVLWFHVYLTGWDLQTINLRDVLAGSLPQTATPASDFRDRTSPQGELSEDSDVPGCAERLAPPPPAPAEIAHVRAALSGSPSPLNGACSGLDHGDGRARGWVTVDVVDACSDLPPGPEYYSAAGGLGSSNVLWGDFFAVDPDADNAAGGPLVRLEADPSLLGAERTFYASWVDGAGTDGREPLPTVWATRFGVFVNGSRTDLLYWRDPGEASAPFNCSWLVLHPWFPLGGPAPLVFDEEENPVIDEGCQVLCEPLPPLQPFVLQSGRVEVNSPDLPVQFAFGWILADLGLDEGPTQSVLVTLMGAEGRYSVASNATPLDEPCSPGFEAPTTSF
jgi:hypothetical protein